MKFLTYTVTFVFCFLIGFHTLNAGDKSSHLLSPSPLAIARADVLSDIQNTSASTGILSGISSIKKEEDQNDTGYKNRGVAFLRSLIIPGAGEHYLGHRTLAKSYFITEITLWVGFFSFRTYGKWLRNDAIAFAATHSGAYTDGKPSQFFVDIGNYINVDEYNDAKQRMRQFDKVYTDESDFWQWDKDINRHDFEQMRIASDRAYNRSVFVLGGIFANHIISAFDAVWRTRSYNRKVDKMIEGSVHLNVQTNYATGEISLNILKVF